MHGAGLVLLLALAALALGGGRRARPRPSPSPGPGPRPAPRPAPPGPRSVAFAKGTTYALTFDMEPGTPAMNEAQLSSAVTDAISALGMTPSGDSLPGDPAHAHGVANVARTLPVPFHFKPPRQVYLLAAVPLGPAVHGRRARR